MLIVQKLHFLGGTSSLYESSGQLKPQCVLEAVSNADMLLLGWFRLRKDSALTPSLREYALHQQLAGIQKLLWSRRSASWVSLQCMPPLLFLSGTCRYNDNHTILSSSLQCVSLAEGTTSIETVCPLILRNAGNAPPILERSVKSLLPLDSHMISMSEMSLRGSPLQSLGQQWASEVDSGAAAVQQAKHRTRAALAALRERCEQVAELQAKVDAAEGRLRTEHAKKAMHFTDFS